MQSLVDLLAPPRCAACRVVCDGDLCAECAHALTCLGESVCARCGSPAPAGGVPRCAGCASYGGFRRARSLLVYDGPARRLVLALKRRGGRALASAAGTLLGDLAVARGLGRPDAVAFVPSGARARRQGFDHTELLAEATADRLGVPLCRALWRRAEGPRQADVGLRERRANVKDRFGADAVGYGQILLVDDVLTTGATAEACASALVGGGASAVDVVTVARTVRRGVGLSPPGILRM